MNPEGASHHEQTRAKIKRGEREDLAKMERKVFRNEPGEEGEEIQSPKRKVIRVEPEETQDYVRESLNLSRDEAEEVSFVPSATSIRKDPCFWCDNRCSGKKAFSFWQFASEVVEDGEKPTRPTCISSVTTNF